jgi:hypothetical protein
MGSKKAHTPGYTLVQASALGRTTVGWYGDMKTQAEQDCARLNAASTGERYELGWEYLPREKTLTIKTKTFTFDLQPYGPVIMSDLRLEPYGMNGALALVGKVIEGTTTNRLFGHASRTSAVGETRHVWGVSQSELNAGSAIRVAM